MKRHRLWVQSTFKKETVRWRGGDVSARPTYIHLTVSNVNKAPGNDNEIEHVPRVRKVVLHIFAENCGVVVVSVAEKKGERGKRERGSISEDGNGLTFICPIAMSIRLPRTMMKSKLFQGSPK